MVEEKKRFQINTDQIFVCQTDKVILLILKRVNSALNVFLNPKYESNHKSYEELGFPAWPSIIHWLPKLALSHQNFENVCHEKKATIIYIITLKKVHWILFYLYCK